MKVTLKLHTLIGKDNFIEQRFKQVKGKTNFKDKEKSEQFRTEGNSEYRNRNNQKALELYTKSIAYAPHDSSELHVAYANRSAVLRSMGKCRECLVDVKRALSHGYPKDKSFKLLIRELQCHRDLENSKEVIESFEKASKITEQVRSDLTEQLEKELKAPRKEVCTVTVIYPDKPPELSYGPSSEIVGASSAVRIAYSDVLMIGENIVGAAMFCSSKCQGEADNKYHPAECATNSKFSHIHGKVITGDTNDRVIRLLAMIGLDNLQPYFKYARTNTKKAWKSMNKEAKRTKGFNSHGVFDSTKIDTIFNLVSKIDEQDQINLFLISFFSLHVPRCFGMSMTHPDFFAVAGLCLQLLDTAILAGIKKSYYDFETTPMKPIIAVETFNPLNALVNHSCFCNLTSVEYGNKHVALAKWPIRKGSILTEIYHYFDARFSNEERRTILKQVFLFDCKCEACEKDWNLNELFCISNPSDVDYLTELLRFQEVDIVKCHKMLTPTYLTPILESFLKIRYDFLTKLWAKGECQDIRCQLIQSRLRTCEWLQTNRVMRSTPPQTPQLMREIVEWVKKNNLK
ncbi:hypothetical protein B566_EDAN006283 [Ephemera danica]|nr:hypothetical protein B566_EDAN006283 [Ephemera danica]